jgi:hypothetical protein
MDTGNLTPRSADVVADMRFSGNFMQPDGFGLVLKVLVRRSGGVGLSLDYKSANGEQSWAVELSTEQRRELAQLLACYEPVLWEPINVGRKDDA